jgi:transglutaminase-like putative cysteine protease
MRNRILKALIGLLVVAVALAGLLGVLEQLSHTKPADISKKSFSLPGTTGPDSQNGALILSPGNAPNIPLPSIPDASKSAGVWGVGSLTGLVPDGFNLGLFNLNPGGLSPNISPQGGLPSHIPLFEISGAADIRYLRSMAHSLYENNTWEIDPSASFSSYLGERLVPEVKNFTRSTRSEVTVTPQEKFLFSPAILPTSLYPASVSSPWTLNYYPSEEAFTSPQGMPDSYSFQSVNYHFDPAILNRASLDPDTRYLQLPSIMPERINQLAQEITRGAASPYQKGKAIESYLKNNYVYDFTYRAAPAGWDPIDWFLFEEKRGVCSNFNSAFVALARSVGIPSRMVSGYAIQATSDVQTVYADQAHAWAEVKFKDLGWISFDATGIALPSIVATRTVITSVSPLIRKGHTFSIQGTVRTLKGEPVDGIPIELFINTNKQTTGAIKIGQGMVSSGAFNIEAPVSDQIAVGNYQLLAHSLGGIKYEHSWSDPPIKITTETRINLNVPDKVKILEPVHLQGKLLEESNQSISGQKIDIKIDNRPVQNLTTDKEGQFAFNQTFNQPGDVTIKASFNYTDFYLSSSQVSHIQVSIPTVLKLAVPSSARISDPDIIQGTLLETLSKKPLSGQTIQVLLNGKPLATPPVTGPDGLFKVARAFNESGIYRVEAKFAGVPYFWEAQDSSVVQISASATTANETYVIIGLFILVFGVGCLIWFYRLRPGSIVAAFSPISSTVESGPEISAAALNGGSKIRLHFEFPDIGSALPVVWGIGDGLKIVCFLTNSDGVPLAAKTLNIEIGGIQFDIITDSSGRAAAMHTFSQKGQFELTAKYSPTTESVSAEARAAIRIVDYREEIIDLYNSLIEWLCRLRIDISPEATPREVKEAVIHSFKRITAEALNDVILCFEEADYSLHPVNRKNYLTMYLAQKEIRSCE